MDDARAASAEHYDRVTDAWRQWIMGEDLHFGWFADRKDDLPTATRRLTDEMVRRLALSPGQEVLDAGCGIGTTALRLAGEAGARVTGVSTSRAGLEVARARAEAAGLGDRARFLEMDATALDLPDAGFDRVLALESVHMMPDKLAFFSECHRVLKPGGRLVLCDVCFVSALDSEIARYVGLGHSTEVAARMRDSVRASLRRAFGATGMAHRDRYTEAAEEVGFAELELEDISAATRATLEHWGRGASRHAAAIEQSLGPAYVEAFFQALLHMSFGWGRQGGYIVLTALR